MALRRLEVVIAGDAKGAKEAFDDVERSSGSFGDRVGGNLGKAALAVGAAAGAAVVGVGWALKGAFEAAEESAKVSRETERVIRTTGGAAHVTADQVGELSGKISDLTGVDDELIQSGANLMLTFTNVRNEAGKGNDVFDQATKLALDMSVALGTDMSGASIQLGKALNDPVKGITALSKAGVSFTEQQKEQIKTLVAHGDILGAQKIVLGELSKEFGGAAEAAATPLDKLKVKLGNFQEQVGAHLIPVVAAAVGWIGDRLGPVFEWVDGVVDEFSGGLQAFLATWEDTSNGVTSSGFAGAMESAAITLHGFWDTVSKFVNEEVLPRLSDALQKVKDVAATVWEWVPNATKWLTDHKEIVQGVGFAVGVVLVGAMVAYTASSIAAGIATLAWAWPFLLIIAVVGGLAAAVMYLWNNWDTFHDVVMGIVTWLQTNVPPIFEQVKQAFIDFYNNALVPVIAFIVDHKEDFANIGKLLLVVAGVIVGVVLVAFAALVVAALALTAVAALVVALFVGLIAVLYTVVQVLWDVFNNVRDWAGGVVDWFENVIQVGWDLARNIGSAIADAARFVWGLYNSVVGMADAVYRKLWEVIDWFWNMPGHIWDAMSGLYDMMKDIGYNIIIGMWNGFVSKFQWLKDRIAGALGSIRNLFPFSPAKEGPFSGRGWVKYSGEAVAAGFAEGIESRTDTVHAAASRAMVAAKGPLVAAGVGGGTAGQGGGNTYVTVDAGFVGNEDEVGRAVRRALDAADRRRGG